MTQIRVMLYKSNLDLNSLQIAVISLFFNFNLSHSHKLKSPNNLISFYRKIFFIFGLILGGFTFIL